MIELGEEIGIRENVVTTEINDSELLSAISSLSFTMSSNQLFNLELAEVRVATIHEIRSYKLWLI